VVKYLSVEIELSAIDNMSKTFRAIEKQIASFEKTLDGLDRTLDDTSISTKESTSQYMKNAAAGWAVNASMNAAASGLQMIGDGFSKAFTGAVDLEVAAVRMAHLIDGITFQELIADIKDFAKESWFTTEQVTTAWNELATIGNFTATEIESLMDSADDLALAIGINLSDAARITRITAKAINSFNLEVSDSTYVIDTLTNAAAVSDLTIQGLLGAFGDVTGAAKLLNIDLDDVVTAIGMIADEASVSGQEAGTFLNMFLTKIQKPSKQGAEAMAELGVSFFDAGGNLRNLGDIFTDLAAASERFNPEEYGNLIATAFEVRGAKAVLAMTEAINENIAAWERYNELVLAPGTAEDIAEDVEEKTSAGKFKDFLAGIENTFFDLVEPVIDVAAAGAVATEKRPGTGLAGIFTELMGEDIVTSARALAAQPGTVQDPRSGASAAQGIVNVTINIDGSVTDDNLQEIVNATGNATGNDPVNDIGA
jgi:TP901 family phage tail tape measure protein